MSFKVKIMFWVPVLMLALFGIGHVYADDRVGPDDILKISVYGYDDLNTETRVSSDGRLNLPLVGAINATGKSQMQLEEEIAKKLVQGGFIHDAHVSVIVLDHLSQYVSVLGYVAKPGRYPLYTDSSLVDMIATAGGLMINEGQTGSDTVLVTRSIDGNPKKFKVNLAESLDENGLTPAFKLEPGDDIYVPKTPMFYVLGEVQRPGNYRLPPETTVMKAIATAGGFTLRGSQTRITINRKSASGKFEESDVNFATEVQRDDVIYIGERWF